MLKEYIAMINKKTASSPIFYISPLADRATGLEDILSNYHIITNPHQYTSKVLKEKGIHIYEIQKQYQNVKEFLQDPEVQRYIKQESPKAPYIQCFKPSKTVEKLCETLGFHLLTAQAHTAARIEDKLSQYALLKKGGFQQYLPKAYIIHIADTTYNDLKSKLSIPFIAQVDRSHSGNGTYLIRSKEEFEMLKPLDMKMKFAEYVSDTYLTINAVATKSGTFSGGLCTQITGLKELHATAGETCGNDWYQEGVSDHVRATIVSLTDQVGTYLLSLGFKGYFGIDFAIKDEHIVIIEINARQTASIQNFSKIQIAYEQIPLGILHVLEFLDLPITIDNSVYSEVNNLPWEASALVIRNHEATPLMFTETKNGLYTVEDMKKEEDACSFDDLYATSKVLILESPPQIPIAPGEELVRMLALGDIFKDNHALDPHIAKIYGTLLKDTKKL